MSLHADLDGASYLQRYQKLLYVKLPPGFYEQIGVVGVAYYYLLWLPYYLPFYVVFYSILDLLPLFYVPLYVVMYQVHKKVVEPCMDTRTRNTSPRRRASHQRGASDIGSAVEDSHENVGPSCGLGRVLQPKYRPVFEDCRVDYDVEERWFHTLGFPKFGFFTSLLFIVIHPVLLPLATIMFVRLIDGLGYWDAFYITCSERTMAGYISHLVGNAESQVAIIENLLR